ncbi:MAG: hypothetical protein AAF657_24705 [Acidobacteriota bacterium]
MEKIAALLELIGSQRPELLDFQIEAITSRWHGLPLPELADAFGTHPNQLSRTVLEACQDLDRLEKTKEAWQDPAVLLERPNLAALQLLCQARLGRVPKISHRRRLAAIRRRLTKAQELARVRGLIEDFIGGGTRPTGPMPEPGNTPLRRSSRRRRALG